MARVTIEDCLEKIDNRFALIHAAAKRCRQLLAGDSTTVGNVKNKPPIVALREIAQGNIELVDERRYQRRRPIRRRRRRYR